MSKWISVKERLPENGVFVDVWIKSTQNKEYGRRKTDVCFVDNVFRNCLNFYTEYVSHWQPLPEPPEADNKGKI